MQSVQKMGGIGALMAAGTFVAGSALSATLFTDLVAAPSSAVAVSFVADHQLALHLWNITITIVFGVVLVPPVLAIGDRLRKAHSSLARVASVFGLIWAGVIIAAGMITNIAYVAVGDLHDTDPEMASTVWVGLDAVTSGLGGGNETLGALWVLGVSTVALRERLFARWVNHLGVVTGVVGLVTVVSALEEAGAAFSLGLTVWFIAVGRSLLVENRRSADQPISPRLVHSLDRATPVPGNSLQADTKPIERQP